MGGIRWDYKTAAASVLSISSGCFEAFHRTPSLHTPWARPVAFNLPGQRLVAIKLSWVHPRARSACSVESIESIELSCMTKPLNSRCMKMDKASSKSKARACSRLRCRDTTQLGVTRPSIACLRCAVQTARTRCAAQPSLPRGPVPSYSVSAVPRGCPSGRAC
jgi:hypothetical protein